MAAMAVMPIAVMSVTIEASRNVQKFHMPATIFSYRSLGARWALTSSWPPFEPAFWPSGIFDFVIAPFGRSGRVTHARITITIFDDHHHPDTTYNDQFHYSYHSLLTTPELLSKKLHLHAKQKPQFSLGSS